MDQKINVQHKKGERKRKKSDIFGLGSKNVEGWKESDMIQSEYKTAFVSYKLWRVLQNIYIYLQKDFRKDGLLYKKSLNKRVGSVLIKINH